MYPSPSVPTGPPTPRRRLRAWLVVICAGAVLGCEDQAEPTTPESPALAAVAAASEEAATSNVAIQAITLPVDQSISTTAPAPAFRITQTGTGPNGIFRINRTTNNQVALLAQTNGSASAFRALTTGTGNAGRFEVNRASSGAAALFAQTNGLGSAGYFRLNNVNSGAPALFAYTNGRGAAGRFQVNTINPAAALWATSDGSSSQGAGLFEVTNGTNSAAALAGRTFGSGYGGVFSGHNRAVLILTDAGGTGLEVGDFNSFGASNSVFNGDVTVNGMLTKSAGSFRIDHPLDPEHKYLSHSFVESPDMLNVYNGNATLDGKGEAVILLPPYFEVLNRDFRYQLTPLGVPGPQSVPGLLSFFGVVIIPSRALNHWVL
jgi:hypothetical protein